MVWLIVVDVLAGVVFAVAVVASVHMVVKHLLRIEESEEGCEHDMRKPLR